jgi:hypothetical protein
VPLVETLTSSGLGSLLGMRHAMEPDHLAAVTTLVSAERSAAKAAWLGFCWGVGHTAALVAVGMLLVVAEAEMPPAVSTGFELLVAAMLVALGVRAIVQAAQQGSQGRQGPMRVHRHGRIVHRHAGTPAHLHMGRWTLARRPLLVGALHGLAGSGALTALVLTTLPSTSARLTYVALFGLGSTVSMAALSGLLGWPLARLSTHHAVARSVSFVVGCFSTGLGMFWGFRLI